MFRCFFFIFKTPKTIYLSSEKKIISSGFQVLRQFVGFFTAINWFNKVFKVFTKCFRSKIR